MKIHEIPYEKIEHHHETMTPRPPYPSKIQCEFGDLFQRVGTQGAAALASAQKPFSEHLAWLSRKPTENSVAFEVNRCNLMLPF